MQNMFEKYGLKEVANVTFYDIVTKKPVFILRYIKSFYYRTNC